MHKIRLPKAEERRDIARFVDHRPHIRITPEPAQLRAQTGVYRNKQNPVALGLQSVRERLCLDGVAAQDLHAGRDECDRRALHWLQPALALSGAGTAPVLPSARPAFAPMPTSARGTGPILRLPSRNVLHHSSNEMSVHSSRSRSVVRPRPRLRVRSSMWFGLKMPRFLLVSDKRSSRTTWCSCPSNHRPRGMANPRLGRSMTWSGKIPRTARLKMPLVTPSWSFSSGGMVAANSPSLWSGRGGRASIECPVPIRSTFVGVAGGGKVGGRSSGIGGG